MTRTAAYGQAFRSMCMAATGGRTMADGYATTIYALCEPTTGEIRYIGKTAYPLEKRLKSHLSGAKRVRNHRTYWIQSLSHAPIIRALCVIEESCAGEMEQRTIASY